MNVGSKMRVRFVLAVFAVFACLPFEAKAQQNIDWSKDLDFIALELPQRHVDFFHSLNKRDFETELNILKKDCPGMSEGEAILQIRRLIASANDGHTQLITDVDSFHYYPLNFRIFDDGVFVIAAAAEYKDVVGTKVIKFGDLSVDEFLAKLKQFVSHDNEFGFRHRLRNELNTAEWYKLCGATNSIENTSMTFDVDGKAVTREFRPIKAKDARTVDWSFKKVAPALYQTKGKLDFWNDWLPDQKTLYFKYNRCRDAKGFARLVEGTKGFVEQNDVQRFVLDLRNNGGGNSSVFKPLLKYLSQHPSLNTDGRLFVIIGRETYSSGMWNAIEMKLKTNAVLIGEPSGGKPNHFGEVRSFELPSSGLTVTYSTRKWTLMKDSDPESLLPDVRIKQLSTDYFNGNDPVMRGIMEYGK